ncbi:MAG: S24/S26 family peptidase [Clostridia bacterium]|nr:S24/S26 family peptidase [Clostridia bacterium]
MSDERKSAEQILAETGIWVSTTSGRSMEPMLHDRRDTVVVEPAATRLCRYDVALYRSGGKLILHRVVRVLPDGYHIRGDHCDVTESVADRQILGVMTSFTRHGRRIDAQNRRYRAYAAVWTWVFPIRFVWHKTRAGLGRVWHKIVPKRPE